MRGGGGGGEERGGGWRILAICWLSGLVLSRHFLCH